MGIAATVRLKREQRRRMWEVYLPWAFREGWRMKQGELLNVYWEEELEGDVDALRRRLGITPPPDLREVRRRVREERRQGSEARAVGKEGGDVLQAEMMANTTIKE